MLTGARLEELLERLPGCRVGVLGDFCLDAYWLLDLRHSEGSLETGKPTRPVREQRYALGGAGNVVANLRALGVGEVDAFAVLGDDPFGEQQRRLLRACGARLDGLVAAAPADWQTPAYIKPYDGAEEQSRIDMGGGNHLPRRLAARLLAALERRLPELQVLIVNQQLVHGVHTPYLRRELAALLARYPATLCLCDSRHHPGAYPSAWLKLNAAEACRLCGVRKDAADVVTRDEALAAARELFARRGRPAFVTRGERGCLVACRSEAVDEVPGLLISGPTDPVGAGDAFLAGVAAALAAGAEPLAAAHLGNLAAAVTVTKLRQTGTASPAEVRRLGARPDFVYAPELADNPRWARHLPDSDIEVVREPPPGLTLRHALFDHDGTLSVLRQGWEEVMEPMMLEAILGDQFRQADEAVFARVRDRVRRHIDQTTGVQTLVQMQGLVEMVAEFGFVPRAARLDAAGYKARYNAALMRRVDERLGRLRRGELVLDDLVIKNAVALLHRLRAAGVTLHLASGTDQADVAAEAAALGYAELFGGRIYGSVGDVTRDAKRVVLDRIFGELDGHLESVVVFGDGPVEMREGERRGAHTVGVASDEVRRYGLNPAKRARLIRAGAAAIIPDFAQLDRLAVFLRLGPTGA